MLDQGYSICGPPEFRHADGTSFAAPQVSAAAALLLAVRPSLRPDQVTALLEHRPSTSRRHGLRPAARPRRVQRLGRARRRRGAERARRPIPPRDRFETNDEAGGDARTLYGPRPALEATLDYWDDQIDVYAIRLRNGQPVSVWLRGPAGTTRT